MQDINRRSFIKWIISAGVASACPFPVAGDESQISNLKSQIPSGVLHSEENAICHKVRDGDNFATPKPSHHYDVVVVGAGPSGLAAADYVQNENFLLLEKEGNAGGNAYSESWEGLNYCTGSAWATLFSEEEKQNFKKWDIDLKVIKGLDATCFKGTWVKNFWSEREDNPSIDQIPCLESDKKSIRQFCRDINKMDWDKNVQKLDRIALSQILKNYTPLLKEYWDYFGPSNWGADSDNTSAYLGIQAAQDWPKQTRYTFEGGLGMGSRKIYEHLSPSARKRVLFNSTVYKVKRKSGKVLISFMHHGQATTVTAKSVVMATPKYITKYLVESLPDDQLNAMGKMRYAPYMVFNLCFDKVVYNQAYDNWVIGAKNFTDFIPADWVTYADSGDLNRKQVITVYAPQKESQRADLLDDAKVLAKAQGAAQELVDLFPGWLNHLREVRIYRRGHPMPMSIPGYYTELQPIASRDFAPIYFAHSDSSGEVSDFAYATLNGIAAVKKAVQHL